MTTLRQLNPIDAINMIYSTHSSGSKGIMSFQRSIEQPQQFMSRDFSAIPVTPIIRSEVKYPVMVAQPEAIAAQLEAPAKFSANNSDKASSETFSADSYDSDKEKSINKQSNENVIVEQKDFKKAINTGDLQEGAIDTANINAEGEAVGAVEVKGFGNRDHYMSEGHIIFRVLDVRFKDDAKMDAKHKPYLKFRLGLSSEKSKNLALEGKSLKSTEEIKVKYTNQDQVRIQIKGKGKLGRNVLASTKVSVVDVIMERKQDVIAPLLKGDNFVGEIRLEMEFVPKN